MVYQHSLCNTTIVPGKSHFDCLLEKRLLEIIKDSKLSEEQVIAKCISVLEDETDQEDVSEKIFSSDLFKAHTLGITGPPGVGKSTLISSLIRLADARNFKVAVIAIDPSSELTGGAFLGDRIRFHAGGKTPNAFIRSIASRKSKSGIPDSISNIIRIFELFRYDFVFLETTGAGQLDIDIRNKVLTLINVLSPNNGDEIQFAKAGLMEIGDIFFVNKSDISDGHAISSFLNQKFNSVPNEIGLKFPISIHGSASLDIGTEELFDEIIAHRLWSQNSEEEQGKDNA
jgi:LAO/AO transport system kinase